MLIRLITIGIRDGVAVAEKLAEEKKLLDETDGLEEEEKEKDEKEDQLEQLQLLSQYVHIHPDRYSHNTSVEAKQFSKWSSHIAPKPQAAMR